MVKGFTGANVQPLQRFGTTKRIPSLLDMKLNPPASAASKNTGFRMPSRGGAARGFPALRASPHRRSTSNSNSLAAKFGLTDQQLKFGFASLAMGADNFSQGLGAGGNAGFESSSGQGGVNQLLTQMPLKNNSTGESMLTTLTALVSGGQDASSDGVGSMDQFEAPSNADVNNIDPDDPWNDFSTVASAPMENAQQQRRSSVNAILSEIRGEQQQDPRLQQSQSIELPNTISPGVTRGISKIEFKVKGQPRPPLLNTRNLLLVSKWDRKEPLIRTPPHQPASEPPPPMHLHAAYTEDGGEYVLLEDSNQPDEPPTVTTTTPESVAAVRRALVQSRQQQLIKGDAALESDDYSPSFEMEEGESPQTGSSPLANIPSSSPDAFETPGSPEAESEEVIINSWEPDTIPYHIPDLTFDYKAPEWPSRVKKSASIAKSDPRLRRIAEILHRRESAPQPPAVSPQTPRPPPRQLLPSNPNAISRLKLPTPTTPEDALDSIELPNLLISAGDVPPVAPPPLTAPLDVKPELPNLDLNFSAFAPVNELGKSVFKLDTPPVPVAGGEQSFKHRSDPRFRRKRVNSKDDRTENELNRISPVINS